MQGIISGHNISTCSFQKEFGLNGLMMGISTFILLVMNV